MNDDWEDLYKEVQQELGPEQSAEALKEMDELGAELDEAFFRILPALLVFQAMGLKNVSLLRIVFLFGAFVYKDKHKVDDVPPVYREE